MTPNRLLVDKPLTYETGMILLMQYNLLTEDSTIYFTQKIKVQQKVVH